MIRADDACCPAVLWKDSDPPFTLLLTNAALLLPPKEEEEEEEEEARTAAGLTIIMTSTIANANDDGTVDGSTIIMIIS